MDDSDQDFEDFSPKRLRRVRKKPGEARQARKAERQTSSQASEEDKRRRNNKKAVNSIKRLSWTQPAAAAGDGAGDDGGGEKRVVNGEVGHQSGDARPSAEPLKEAGPSPQSGLRAKDKVLLRMKQFKRDSPQKMVHKTHIQPANHESNCTPFTLQKNQDTPDTFSSALPPEPQDNDEALALQLQQELDREAAQAQIVDLEDGGLFFCQICHRDLTHMTAEGRTQHLNRCLDESEKSGPAAPPPPPPPPSGVPDCPICGKKFKSQKSRSVHLKRCSSDMDVSPAVLIQALQRQAEETQSAATANLLIQAVGTKRKGPIKPGLPARKKPKKKPEPLDEETMVALALSSSLLEQKKEEEREYQTKTGTSHTSVTQDLKWRPDAGKGRGKRKKGVVPRPPPLLLIQDAEGALRRLQERVSALLLRSPPDSPPTPPRSPSTLHSWSGAAPLWEKSRLLDGDSTCLSDFYVPELREFFTPWVSAMTDAASEGSSDKPESCVQPVGGGTPTTAFRTSILPSSAKTASCSPAPSTPGTGQLSVSSQVLRDLMDLADEGMTLTQYGYTAKDNASKSGFIQEESEEQADLCASGFLPERAHTHAEERHSQAMTAAEQPREKVGDSHQSVALSTLASDLSSMVNNPQLSDVQLQVDSGEVFFAHSFMVYARCPLLAEMMHESGFGVQEEGVPPAQRVLISDVPAQAVFAVLQYLYTAHCSLPASLQPHVLELAQRFDLQELQQLCHLGQEETLRDEGNYLTQEEETDQAFIELLRSMWNEDDADGDDGEDSDRGRDEGLEGDRQADEVTSGDREIHEEKVNEEELEEIYEFASTQRKREEEKDSEEEEEAEALDEEEDGETKKSLSDKKLQPDFQREPDPSLDRSYSRLFSDSWGVYEEAEPSSLASTSGLPKVHLTQQSPCKPSYEFSGRALLQSSASVVSDPSISPPPGTSNLPVPGVSPGQVGHVGGSGDKGKNAVELKMPKEDVLEDMKRESQGPYSICTPHSPDSAQIKDEPELIVLSDSSEEDVAVLSSRSPLPRSPSYTEIKSRHNSAPKEPALNKEASSLGHSAGDQLDCSPEVSWLIPSTPVRPGSGTRSSSTQTRSSMCRTQLFRRSQTSPSSPSVFSSPTLKSNLHPSNSQTKDSADTDQMKGNVSRLKIERNFSFSPKRENSEDSRNDRERFKVPLPQPKLSNLSSSPHLDSLQASLKHDIPLQHHPQPYSSTPLQTELHHSPMLLASSLLHTHASKQNSPGQKRERAPSDSQEKTDLGSFHLSPLSDPSGPRSSSSHSFESSPRHTVSSSQSQRSLNSSIYEKRLRNEKEGRETDSNHTEEMFNEGQEGEIKIEADVEESSFRQSFMAMDEPPLAFNDSWGLDMCVDADPGCFSLRLEDSGQRETTQSLTSPTSQPESSRHGSQSLKRCGGVTTPSTPKCHSPQVHAGPSITTSPPKAKLLTTPEIDNGLLDSKIWDSWEEEEEEEHLPLSKRVNPSTHHKTPVSSHSKRRRTLVPITPMPHYSDMDTPELKNKLDRFGVRPLPKRQMILKLKEIHQYTHQLLSSDSEDEAPVSGATAQMKPPASRPVSCAQTVKFKEPRAPADVCPAKHNGDEVAEPLSNSQGSNTSSAGASEESERSNPELCISSDGDSDSDGGISASQAASRLQDRLKAVRSFILSDSKLYSQILQYKPLVLSQLQEQLKAAGIRLGAAKLMDYLDSQCITFTTAKPGHAAPSCRRVKRTGKAGKSR
ncbi:unnamed protein product [Oreochromis niloticus]|nr:unnamed protein product [Mustela putorius furo]